MLDSLEYTIFEDRALFEGASTSTIREHFKTWVATAPQEEQGTGPARSQRYEFCIQVDAETLHSVVYDAPPFGRSDVDGKGWVKLIWREWEPDAQDSSEGEHEPIEGVTTEEIGWSRAAYQYVMVDTYCMIRSRHEWCREYHRPPRVIIP